MEEVEEDDVNESFPVVFAPERTKCRAVGSDA
jgi:hypothetical protein